MQRAEFAPQHINYAPLIYVPRQVEAPMVSPLEQALSGDSLLDLIHHFRQNYRIYELPSNWYDLPKVGFIMDAQMNQLPDLEILTKESFATWLQLVNEDVHSYTQEYILRQGVFPDSYEIDHKNQRVYNPRYGNKDIEEIFLAQERKGSVQKSIRALKEFMLHPNTIDGSIFGFDSVNGPSDLYLDQKGNIVFSATEGKEIIFPDDQCYIFRKEGNKVRGVSVRTSANHKQASDFLKEVGVDIPVNATPEEFVASSFKFCANDMHHNFRQISDVIRAMQKGHKTSYSFVDSKYGVYIPWNNIYEKVDHDFSDFDIRAEQYIHAFIEFAWQIYGFDDVGFEARQLLKEALAATILEIANYVGPQRSLIFSRRRGNILIQESNYGGAYKAMVAVGGCGSTREESSGGMFGEKVFDLGFLRIGFLGGEFDEDGPLSFQCTNGHWNKRPRNNGFKKGRISKCKTCGESLAC